MIYVEDKNLVIPGQILADDDYYPGRGTFKEDGKIFALKLHKTIG